MRVEGHIVCFALLCYSFICVFIFKAWLMEPGGNGSGVFVIYSLLFFIPACLFTSLLLSWRPQ